MVWHYNDGIGAMLREYQPVVGSRVWPHEGCRYHDRPLSPRVIIHGRRKNGPTSYIGRAGPDRVRCRFEMLAINLYYM